MTFIDSDLLATSLRLAAPLYYAALGGIICERAGVLNVGLEGLMLMGAICANVATVLSGSLVVGVCAGVLLGGVLFGAGLGVLMVRIKADQLVVGIAFNLFALGFSSFIREVVFGVNAGPNAVRTPPFPTLEFAWLEHIPVLGAALSSANHSECTYSCSAVHRLVPVATNSPRPFHTLSRRKRPYRGCPRARCDATAHGRCDCRLCPGRAGRC